MKNTTQTAIRSNTVPQGGATNPASIGNQISRAKMPEIAEKEYFENFRNLTEFNTIAQAPVTLQPGTQSNYKVVNIGFLETIWNQCKFTYTITNPSTSATTINFGADFPYSHISRITSQFNGATVTHNCTPYNLYTISMKRNNGLKGNINTAKSWNKATDSDSLVLGSLGTINADLNYITSSYYVKITNVTGTGNQVNYRNDGLTNLKSITLGASSTVTLDVMFFVPLHYTPRKDMLIGLIPLQNNSVYLDVKLDTNNIISSSYSTPLQQTDTVVATISDITASVTPYNDFYSVPDPRQATSDVYSYLLYYNYIVTDTNLAIQNYGTDALSYNMPNNSYLTSILTTMRDSKTNELLDVDTYLGGTYIDYNGTAVIQKVPTEVDKMKQNLTYNGGFECGKGQALKDFYNSLNEENGADWSRAINLYDANSPVFKGNILQAVSNGLDVNITMEKIIPVDVQVL